MKTKIVLAFSLVVVLVAGCINETVVHRQQSAPPPGADAIVPVLVWKVSINGYMTDVYEFTDLERGEHCYVIVYYHQTALSCEKVGE